LLSSEGIGFESTAQDNETKADQAVLGQER
jgi:hypothetical protein